jgi:hypothetical protein
VVENHVLNKSNAFSLCLGDQLTVVFVAAKTRIDFRLFLECDDGVVFAIAVGKTVGCDQINRVRGVEPPSL